MIADPLTKAMKPDRLREFMDSGLLDLNPTAESVLAKMQKQKARRKKDLDDVTGGDDD